VNFTPDDSGTVTATRFRVSAAPISYFTPAPLLYCVGNVQNGYGMALASNAAALDTGLYQATTTGPASTFWPTGSAYCPNTPGTTALCKGYAATVTTAGRVTSLASFPGHLLNVGAFAAQAGGFNGTQNVNNGVPVLEMRATLPTTFSTRTLAEITDFSSAGWPTSTGPLYGYSGMLVYDYDAFGRVRPFMKAVMYPIYNYNYGTYGYAYFYFYWYRMYCYSATACSWSLVSSFFVGYIQAFGLYNYLNMPPPTASTPWSMAIDRDPVAGTWSASHITPAYTYGGGNLVGATITDATYFSASTAGAYLYWTNCACAGGALARAGVPPRQRRRTGGPRPARRAAGPHAPRPARLPTLPPPPRRRQRHRLRRL
jgi:hypothetical protein